MPNVKIVYLGRLIGLKPASLGSQFHKLCTVNRIELQMPSYENDWRTVRVADPVNVYWYDTDPSDGEPLFCAYSGYFDVIYETLTGLGFSVTVEDRVFTGLEEPQFEKLSTITWRPNQVDAVASILARRGGLVVCPTAFGKTFLAKQLAKLYPTAKIVISAPSRDIVRQIYADLAQDLPDVGQVGGGKNCPKRITVAVAKSLHKCYEEASLVLIDEAHTMVTTRYIKSLNRFWRAKFIGFTATPEGRGDEADGFLRAVFGEQIVQLDYASGVQAGNVVPLDVRMYNIQRGPNVDNITSKATVDRIGLWLNRERNEYIATVVKNVISEFGNDVQILVMVDRVMHAYALYTLLSDFTVVTGPVTATQITTMTRRGLVTPDFQFCTTQMRDTYRKDFESRKILRAIATGVWKQGVDFRDLQILVRADGAAGKIDSTQIPGRLSRLGKTINKESGLLIDFMDSFSRRLLSRSRARLAVYKSNGWNIERLG